MNIFILSLINRSIEGAIIRFSQLPIRSSILSSGQLEKIARLIMAVFNSYVVFYRNVSIITNDFLYDQQKIVKKFYLVEGNEGFVDELEMRLSRLIPSVLDTFVIPVNIHLKNSGYLYLFSGLGILDSTERTVIFFLHKFSIAEASLEYSTTNLKYLETVLESGNFTEGKSLRDLVSTYGKNYNQFQKECKEYFGDTFHQFLNKMKMLGALEDQLFTNYSFKEIAYRNGFSNYNNLHFLFRKKYNFPFDLIPRLLKEI